MPKNAFPKEIHRVKKKKKTERHLSYCKTNRPASVTLTFRSEIICF